MTPTPQGPSASSTAMDPERRSFPADVAEDVTLVTPMAGRTPPQDIEDRNFGGGTLDAASLTARVVILDGPPSTDLHADGNFQMRGNIRIGQWWPFGGKVFFHLIQLRDINPNDQSGFLVFGRRVPIPRTDPDDRGRALIEGVKAWGGEPAEEAIVVKSIDAPASVTLQTRQGEQVLAPGAQVRMGSGWAWRIVAVHAAAGELPAYVEVKLLRPGE